MNDFHEAALMLNVEPGMGNIYKQAIEVENSPFRENWNGNHVYVEIGNELSDCEFLTITLLSHTLPNLKETVDWYEKMGCEIILTNYKGENQNG